MKGTSLIGRKITRYKAIVNCDAVPLFSIDRTSESFVKTSTRCYIQNTVQRIRATTTPKESYVPSRKINTSSSLQMSHVTAFKLRCYQSFIILFSPILNASVYNS